MAPLPSWFLRQFAVYGSMLRSSSVLGTLIPQQEPPSPSAVETGTSPTEATGLWGRIFWAPAGGGSPKQLLRGLKS